MTHVAPGDRVMAVTGYGAFAEEVKTDARRLLPIRGDGPRRPRRLFQLTYGTSDHALRGSRRPESRRDAAGARAPPAASGWRRSKSAKRLARA